jgi:hypothetical protein
VASSASRTITDGMDATPLPGQHERDHLYESIQALVGLQAEEGAEDREDDGPLPEGCMLRSFVVVAEFVDPDGSRWFSYRNGDASGGGLMPWEQKGLLSHALDNC